MHAEAFQSQPHQLLRCRFDDAGPDLPSLLAVARIISPVEFRLHVIDESLHRIAGATATTLEFLKQAFNRPVPPESRR